MLFLSPYFTLSRAWDTKRNSHIMLYGTRTPYFSFLQFHNCYLSPYIWNLTLLNRQGISRFFFLFFFTTRFDVYYSVAKLASWICDVTSTTTTTENKWMKKRRIHFSLRNFRVLNNLLLRGVRKVAEENFWKCRKIKKRFGKNKSKML